MSEIVTESLQKVSKGAAIVLIGAAVGRSLSFIGRIVVVRYITPSEYGIFSLAMVLMSIFGMIATLGLHEGVARQLAFYRGKNDILKVKAVILSSLQIVVISSIFLSLVLFLTSKFISIDILHNPELITPLKIFSIAIPFGILIGTFISIFRGFESVAPKVYFEDALRNALFPLLLFAVILLGLSFIGVVYAYVVSTVLTCAAFAIYGIKKAPLALKGVRNISINPITER